MAVVIITKRLEKEINKKFKEESIAIFTLMRELQNQPKKGKEISVIGRILVKELKYKSYRFYFIMDGYKIKFLKTDELKDLVIKFVRMSDKNSQQKVIDEIKTLLRELGEEGF
ncbi:MAG: hypothetical protein KKF44_02285 [Nanoarchaeota archaeon]|nr:hypothetical protein [Nanoarchaeota archaeon]